MKKASIEVAVGIFVLIGMICIGYLTIRLGKLEIFSRNTYPLVARFESVTGLKPGASVEISGVEVGKVDSIGLDFEKQMAVVTMQIQNGIALDEEVIASIRTSGLIGDKFIKLSQGGADDMLKSGDQITETESVLDIEELISKYIFSEK